MEPIGRIAKELEPTIGRSRRPDRLLDRLRGRKLPTAPKLLAGIALPAERPQFRIDEAA